MLYVKQPTGFGGGGAPLLSFGYVEPNPLVRRIAMVAASTYRGLEARGVGVNPFDDTANQSLAGTMSVLRDVALTAGRFAEMARRELTNEALSEDDYYTIQGFSTFLNVTLRSLYMGEGEPDPVALVTDIAKMASPRCFSRRWAAWTRSTWSCRIRAAGCKSCAVVCSATTSSSAP